MRNTIRIIGASLASMAGLLLVSGVAWAQAEETSIVWRNLSYVTLEEAERFWVDEDGIEHGRNEMYTIPRRLGMRGDEMGWVNWDGHPASGDYFERGYFTFIGRVLGEPANGVGRYTTECHRIDDVQICTGEDLVHLYRGGLVRTSATWEFPTGGETIFWRGTVLDPPGDANRNGPRRR